MSLLTKACLPVWGLEVNHPPAHLHAAPQVPIAPAQPMAGEQSRPPALATCERVQGERHGDDEQDELFQHLPSAWRLFTGKT